MFVSSVVCLLTHSPELLLDTLHSLERMGHVFLMHESSRCQSLPQSPPPTTSLMEEATLQASLSSHLEEAGDSNLMSIILHVSSSDFFMYKFILFGNVISWPAPVIPQSEKSALPLICGTFLLRSSETLLCYEFTTPNFGS